MRKRDRLAAEALESEARGALHALRILSHGGPSKLVRCAPEDVERWAPPFMVDGVPHFLATIITEPDGRERLVCRGADDTSLEITGTPADMRTLLSAVGHGTAWAELWSWGMVWG